MSHALASMSQGRAGLAAAWTLLPPPFTENGKGRHTQTDTREEYRLAWQLAQCFLSKFK